MREPRRIPVWKVLAGLALGLSLMLGLAALYVRSAVDRRWALTEAKARALIAEVKARDPRRPALLGDPLPGNAWDDYRAAMALLNGVRSGEFTDAFKNASADPGASRMSVALHRDVLRLLQSGARRAEALPTDVGQGYRGLPGLLDSMKLVQLARCAARFDDEDGHRLQAADLLLAATQFCRDHFDGTPVFTGMIGAALLKEVLEEFEGRLSDDRWTADALLRIERGLGVLYSAFPAYSGLIFNEAVYWGADLIQDPDGWAGWPSMEAWRYSFSSRLVLAEAFDDAVDRGVQAAEGRSWARFQQVAQARSGRGMTHQNPLIRSSGRWEAALFRSARTVWELRTRIQLLRLKARYRATGEVLVLEDPFGGTLRTSAKDGRLTAWSVGPHGYHVDAPGPLRIEVDAPLE